MLLTVAMEVAILDCQILFSFRPGTGGGGLPWNSSAVLSSQCYVQFEVRVVGPLPRRYL